jgi:hypothetical protein
MAGIVSVVWEDMGGSGDNVARLDRQASISGAATRSPKALRRVVIHEV